MPAILFGSISTLSDTSELQRAAFNTAFTEHGLDWAWERAEYQAMLAGNGGRQRIADYAASRGETVDAGAVHATKSRRFRDSLGGVAVRPRPGVVETIREAREQGWKLGLVTTTSAENVTALLDALDLGMPRDGFDVVLDSSAVDTPKPDPAVYLAALETLGERAADCVAIEDNVGGVQSATSAGIPCVVFANENTAGHDFGDAARTAHLEFAELVGQTAHA